MKSMVELSHSFLKPAIHKQALCLDMTLGNGMDTRFFLKSHAAKVIAFEIQPDVLSVSLKAINDDRLSGYAISHDLADTILGEAKKEQVDAVIFNFGYCPKRDERICTQASTSLKAVQIALEYLKVKGRAALVFYEHDGWKEEADAVESWLAALNPHVFAIQKIVQFNAPHAPFLLCIEKKKSTLPEQKAD